MRISAPHDLLSAFPLVRSTHVGEASTRIGQVFSPHRLHLRDEAAPFRALLNHVRLQQVSLNVLSYGADVTIDPGQRGDFYMLQLPLAGHAQLHCDDETAYVDENVLSVLHPHSHSSMRWSKDCTMLLLQAQRSAVSDYHHSPHDPVDSAPRFALCHARTQERVSAWWQMALDLTYNVHQFGTVWTQHPAAASAMEQFLLSAFSLLLQDQNPLPIPCNTTASLHDKRGDQRSLKRAKEYISAHLHTALTLKDIADFACVSPRTLEAIFKRQGEGSPLAWARKQRLIAVHQTLKAAAQHGQAIRITDTALSFGFVHMGRFSAQYRAMFGTSPSATLKP